MAVSLREKLDSIESPKFAPRLYSIAVLITLIVLSGIWLVRAFTEQDLARDLENWREKLNLVAESRSEAVHDWVDSKFGELRALADNPSLQLYLTQLQENNGGAAAENIDAAQKSYLRNLLLFTADRAGFSKATLSSVNANVDPASNSGLAIIDKDHHFVVSTSMTAPTRDMLLRQAAAVPKGKENLIDVQKDPDGNIVIGFSVPIYSIQGDRTADAQIGTVVGVILLDNKLAALLKHPAITEKTLEVILTRKDGTKIEFLSPLQDGSKTLDKQIGFEPRKYAEAGLIQTTGNFLSEYNDYRNKPVLATSREIPATPWVLIAKIDRAEALIKSDQQRANMVAFFFMLIAFVVALIIAIWWYAHSRRSMMMSYHFRKLASQAIAQEELLALVTNNQLQSVYIIDDTHLYRFANRAAANTVNAAADTMLGKSVFDIQGTARGEWISSQCDKALSEDEAHSFTGPVLRQSKEFILRHQFIPLSHIPIHSLPGPRKGVLVVEQDITNEMRERERRIETQRQLVHTLVRLVDKRDPFAANHSTLVSMIAKEIAIDMGLTAEMVETTYTAGNLMNIGKMMVPKHLLTKVGDLTEEEKRIVFDSMNSAVDVLKGINFDGPVTDTLRQWQEKVDGSGPLGMKGDNILISARIIAASNAFIGMISPRSWRQAMPVEKASEFLMKNSDNIFDRKVVVALVNHIENHKGRAWIEQTVVGKRNIA
ncbi:MAG: HD domain-containing phosphohydrolase [Alphaproteobacteria bacterium]